MNRIVVIGNGFDKAHGLATGYKDFIDDYWSEFGNEIYSKYTNWKSALTNNAKIGTHGTICHEDDFVRFEIYRGNIEKSSIATLAKQKKGAYHGILEKLNAMNDRLDGSSLKDSLRTTFKNRFFEHISNRCYLTNWVDIENEYYEQLKELLTESDTETRHKYIEKLNQDFEAVKKMLEKYLVNVVENAKPSSISSVQKAFESFIEPKDVAHKVQADFIESVGKKSGVFDEYTDQKKSAFSNEMQSFWENQIHMRLNKGLQDDIFKTKYCQPENTLLLNFNYTDIAERLYASKNDEVIHIHGELDNEHNPIIFGYGDELDEEYKRIEKLQDNDFLENIKSIRYHETGNYRNLLSFLEADLYQVVVMGHSCGNSDRTLLNTMLEHPNCASVKVYYHQIDAHADNYSQIVRNLSRNFNDKAAMRDKVVNKELCSPLVPIEHRT